MKSPCKDCPDRQFQCHDACEKYVAFVRYREKIRQKRAEHSRKSQDVWTYKEQLGKKREF